MSAGSCIWPTMTAKVDAPKMEIVRMKETKVWKSLTFVSISVSGFGTVAIAGRTVTVVGWGLDILGAVQFRGYGGWCPMGVRLGAAVVFYYLWWFLQN